MNGGRSRARIGCSVVALLIFLSWPATAVGQPASSYTFATIAGFSGSAIGSTDGIGPAARFAYPTDVAVDGAGNVYVADQQNFRIRKITSTGLVSTLTLTPAPGAGFFPVGLTVDGQGNLYLASGGNAIRKVSPTGVVTTLPPLPTSGVREDVALDSAGTVYVMAGHSVWVITPAGQVTLLAGQPDLAGHRDGAGSEARFNDLRGIAVDSAGTIYVSDSLFSHTIRKISPGGVVTTLAGSPGRFGTEDGTGAEARFNAPRRLTVDAQGLLWVADAGNGAIRTVTANGVVRTIAGSSGTYGDADGYGAAALFSSPSGIDVDSAGVVYVADTDNCMIRKVTPDGRVTTIAGVSPQASLSLPHAIAVDGAQRVSLADTGTHTLRRIGPTGGVGVLAGSIAAWVGQAGSQDTSLDGTGGAARFNEPTGIAVDSSGNAYVADTDSHTIRKITPAGIVSTLAGSAGKSGSADADSSAARFNQPWGLAVDGMGNVYVADTFNCTIRKITPTGAVTTLAGLAGYAGAADGAGSAARFSFPRGLAIDAAGTLYVADSGNLTIRMVSPQGVVGTLAGAAGSAGTTDGPGSVARFAAPWSVAVGHDGVVYVGEAMFGFIGPLSGAVRRITPAGVVSTLVSAATLGYLLDFQGVAVDSTGVVYAADSASFQIRKITPNGAISGFAGILFPGSADGQGSDARFSQPKGITIDGTGRLFVADTRNETIRVITPTAVVSTLAGTPGVTGLGARFRSPKGIAVQSGGTISIADTGNNTIRRSTPDGVVTTLAGLALTTGSADGLQAAARFNEPSGIAVDESGTAYVADTGNHTIRKVTAAGVVSTLAGLAGASGSADGAGSAARFSRPSGIAVDGSGTVFVADTANHTIRAITPAGVVSTLAGSPGVAGSADGTSAAARFSSPSALAVNGVGTLFIADTGNHVIRAMTVAGVVSTIGGFAGVSGTADGAGASARFASPGGIAVDSGGTLYIADTASGLIRRGVFGALVVPTVTSHPVGQAIVQHWAARFTVAAAGNPLPVYQWQVSTNGGASWTTVTDGDTYAGTATATLTVVRASPSLHNALFRCVVTSTAGSATSDAAVLSVSSLATPFGAFDTPSDARVAGSIPVTGWALDDLAVDRVEIWRDLMPGEPTVPFNAPGHPGHGKVYIANALFVTGARPDVEAAFPGGPFLSRAGWGYLLLTWGLWNQGNGVVTLYAFAFDQDGNRTTLGTKTVTSDNANATKPFGALDVPAYGETKSGLFFNFGWALTPNANTVDPRSCTITDGNVFVGIDSGALATVDYGDNRADVAGFFPGFSNGNSGGGHFLIDTTMLANGTHQIGWYVVDNCGRADGIGSRFFTVLNGSSVTAADASVRSVRLQPDLGDGPRKGGHYASGDQATDGPTGPGLQPPDVVQDFSPAVRAVAPHVVQDFSPAAPAVVRMRKTIGEWTEVPPNAAGVHVVAIDQSERIEVRLPAPDDGTYTGAQIVNGERRALPLGSSLDAEAGIFYWQPAAGFLGTFELEFSNPSNLATAWNLMDVRNLATAPNLANASNVSVPSIRVRVVVGPPMRMAIDSPAAGFVGEQPFIVAGWAIDLAATDGSGIDTVHVWAYPAAGGDAIFLGVADVGDARPDVAAIYGAQFERSSYSLAAPPLAPGTYDVVVYPHRAASGAFDGAQAVRVTVQ